jgi:hypothetical protein
MANQYEKLAEQFSPRGGQQHPEMPTNLQEWADQQMSGIRGSVCGFVIGNASLQMIDVCGSCKSFTYMRK